MYFLIAGVGALIWNYWRIGFVYDSSWWWALAPFALAVAWWAWADSTGYTKRKAIEKMDAKKKERIDKHKAAMGIQTRKR
jgi:small Trp-rich protein